MKSGQPESKPYDLLFCLGRWKTAREDPLCWASLGGILRTSNLFISGWRNWTSEKLLLVCIYTGSSRKTWELKKSRENRMRERGSKINCSICLVCQDRRASSMFGVCFLPKVLSECSPVCAEQDTTLSNAVKTTGFGVRETWVWVLAPPLTSWEALASHPSLTFCLNLADTRLMDCWEDINDRVLSGESSIYWEFLMHWPLWLLKVSPAWFPLSSYNRSILFQGGTGRVSWNFYPGH